ncbi:MAG: hypothetical protein E6R05_04335 [Candidatus Moraniibacteriota bacterium]|nr:MAG: hypothetical protein E6R05_04335 [Candidatus Moranbacteria bacterium]
MATPFEATGEDSLACTVRDETVNNASPTTMPHNTLWIRLFVMINPPGSVTIEPKNNPLWQAIAISMPDCLMEQGGW